MKVSQAGLLWILRAIWEAKSKVSREEVEKLADELEKEGLFEENEAPENQKPSSHQS